ncbi:MAG: M28 family peptidase [Phycisphaerales bacterium]
MNPSPTTTRFPLTAAVVAAVAAAAGTATAGAETKVELESALLTPSPSERAALTPTKLISPIADALASVPDDVRAFDMHISTLANPFLQGRTPGTPGSEVAKAYIEFYLKHAGLVRPFQSNRIGPNDADGMSFRQPFELGGRTEVVAQRVSATPAVGGGAISMVGGEDFNATGLGSGGEAEGQAVFVGYSTVTDEYDAYAPEPDLDLTGKIAVMLRFEPMDEVGNSKFTGGRWSGAAGFNSKLRAVAERNPAAVVLINPPKTSDRRGGSLLPAGGGGRSMLDVPVFHMTSEAGDRLLSALDGEGRSLAALQALADSEPHIIAFDGRISLLADVERTPLVPENVAGLLPGRGDLANEYIVIGGHFDHTGNGGFGEPQTLAQVHEGADDNASGTAGVLILADRLAKTYASLPEGAHARSILFIAFDAEESGLNGAAHYVANPIAPIEDHILMLNMDMIGRIVDGGVTLHGVPSAIDFERWLTPFMEASPLSFSMPSSVSRRSDHAPFYFDGNMPVLFAICDPLHSDYHTDRDEAWKINRVGAVQVIDFFENIATAAALQPQRLEYAPPTQQAATQQSRVIVGVLPQTAEDGGVLLMQVTPETSASEGGLLAQDRIVEWNGQEVADVDAWRAMLSAHSPGDVVELVVVRDGERLDKTLTLRAR